MRVSGVASVLPDGSVACAVKVCSPSPSSEKNSVPSQPSTSSPSSVQANVDPSSFEPTVKEATVSVVASPGPPSIAVTGGVRSRSTSIEFT